MIGRSNEMKKTAMVLAALIFFVAGPVPLERYDVTYNVEVRGECVKFEDALYDDPDTVDVEEVDAGLGEEGVIETEVFLVRLDTECYDVTVCVKAGDCESCAPVPLVVDESGEGVGELELCGFTIHVVTDGDTYLIMVRSDDDKETAALSYIELCFCGEATVTEPVDGPYTMRRLSPNDAPGVEEEEEEIEIEDDAD
jgi:hypothetical protein